MTDTLTFELITATVSRKENVFIFDTEINNSNGTMQIPNYRNLMIAPMIYLACLIFIGIPGNILVLVVYGLKHKASVNKIIIVTLAIYDLLVSVITLPFEFFDLYNFYSFPSKWACVIFRTSNYFLVFNSTLIIQLMTVERYRRVCYPLKPQISIKLTLRLVLIICIISAVATIPNVFLRGIETMKFENNSTGYSCAVVNEFLNSKFLILYNLNILIICIFNVLCIITLYILIGRKICKHFQFLHNVKLKYSEKQPGCKSIAGSIISIEGNHANSSVNTSVRNLESHCKGNKILTVREDSLKSTKIAVMIGIFFIISYIPTLLEIVLEDIYGESFVGNYISLPVRTIIQKTFCINHVINPFIYGFMDRKFRTECQQLLRTVIKTFQ